MKIWIISNKNNHLGEELENQFHIPRYTNIVENEIPSIIRKEKNWIIEYPYDEEKTVLAIQATTIILIQDKLLENNKEWIKKYRNKMIILKNNKEIKKCILAITKDTNYW